jgi:hypothetical protein
MTQSILWEKPFLMSYPYPRIAFLCWRRFRGAAPSQTQGMMVSLNQPVFEGFNPKMRHPSQTPTTKLPEPKEEDRA